MPGPERRPRGRGRPPGRAVPGRAVPQRRHSPAPALWGEQVEGRRATRELLSARTRRAREVWLAEEAEPSPLLEEIAQLCVSSRVPLKRVSSAKLAAAARTESHQGVVAKADPLPRFELEELARPLAGRPPFLMVADGITDPYNLGALMRSAEAAGVTGVVLGERRCARLGPTVAKAAAGAIEHLRVAVVAGIPAALSDLHRLGVWSVGLAPEAEASVFDLDVATEPLALVLGAEGSGLSRLVRQRCDALARIPQQGRTASLNVSAAGAVAFFEIARRRSA